MNFFDPDGWANGQALEAALHAQREGPLRWVPGLEVFAVLGHAEAVEVLSDPARFTSSEGTGLSPGGTTGRSLNLMDGPPSRELRGLVQQVIDRPLEPALEAQLAQDAGEAIDRARAKGSADALGDLGEVVARGTFARVFGLAPGEVTTLARLTEGLSRSGRARDAQEAADAALRDLLRQGLSDGREGPFWDLGQRALAKGLTAEDAMFLLRLVVQTGHESTAQAIAGAVHAALEAGLPFACDAKATDEWLRWTSPLVRFARVAREDTSVSGVGIRKGARLAVLFPVVNRDPRVFTTPERLVLDRAPNPHLAFGAGPHACAGSRLARRQLSAVMEALAKVPRPSLSGAPPRLVSSVTRGFVRVPLTFP